MPVDFEHVCPHGSGVAKEIYPVIIDKHGWTSNLIVSEDESHVYFRGYVYAREDGA